MAESFHCADAGDIETTPLVWELVNQSFRNSASSAYVAAVTVCRSPALADVVGNQGVDCPPFERPPIVETEVRVNSSSFSLAFDADAFF